MCVYKDRWTNIQNWAKTYLYTAKHHQGHVGCVEASNQNRYMLSPLFYLRKESPRPPYPNSTHGIARGYMYTVLTICCGTSDPQH